MGHSKTYSMKKLNSYFLRTFLIRTGISLAIICIAKASRSDIIHTIQENESKEIIEYIHRKSLHEKSISEINSHIKKINYIKNKELIVHSKSKIYFCNHRVKKGEWLAKIVRNTATKTLFHRTYSFGHTKKSSHPKSKLDSTRRSTQNSHHLHGK